MARKDFHIYTNDPDAKSNSDPEENEILDYASPDNINIG